MVVEPELAPLSCFLGSVVLELAPALDWSLDGAAVLDEDDEAGADGVVLEPAPAEPLMLAEPEAAGAELDEPEGAALEDDDAPPLAWSFLSMSIEVDEELEPAGALGVVAVPPADEDEDEPGWVVAPEGAVVDEDEERSVRSHAASSEAPNARETTTAMVESLMGPPWLGY